MKTPSILTSDQQHELLTTLKQRFEQHMHRHEGMEWDKVQAKLISSKNNLWSIYEMERTGGEPDLVVLDPDSKEFTFVDCSTESPAGRRSLCFDQAAHDSRKVAKPKGSAIELASSMGIEMLNEQEYRLLQQFEAFDTKTSSWIQTPKKIRKLGGALFCDRRYDTVFVYHNGAESYYAARGFRGILRF